MVKKNNKAEKAAAILNHSKFVHRIDALVEGKRTSEPGFGVVKCVKAAKKTKNHQRQFSVSGSTIAKNRGGYTFAKLMEAFGIHR